MSKGLKISIAIIVLVGLLLLVTKILNNDIPTQIKNYLLNNNYVVSSEDDTLLLKRISSSTINYFSLADFTTTQNIESDDDGIESSLSIRYSFQSHDIIYNYNVRYSDNINVLYRGNYDEETGFNCNKEFSTAKISQNDIDLACNLVKIKVERFFNESEVLFNNYKFVEYIEKKVID